VFPAKRAGQPKPEQEVLTKRDQTQEKLRTRKLRRII